VLEPERWIGKQFPLLPFINDYTEHLQPGTRPLRERLVEGKWSVVLYRRGCQKCRDILERCKHNSEQSGGETKQRISVAIVEIPPVTQAATPGWCEVGKLGGWTPVVYEGSDCDSSS
jgi:hypothetical protein